LQARGLPYDPVKGEFYNDSLYRWVETGFFEALGGKVRVLLTCSLAAAVREFAGGDGWRVAQTGLN
jgi:hypothetical protein